MGKRGLEGSQFHKDLIRSQTLSEDEGWVEFYQKIFGDGLKSVVGTPGHSEWQKHGIDRLLLFSNGKQLTVDEKKRFTDYEDFLAEIQSPYFGPGDPRNRWGWTVDPEKKCDYIAYGPSGGRFYLLPFEILRLTTRREHRSWKEVTTNKDFKDSGYLTINRAVSWNKLWLAMRRTVEVEAGGKLKLQICGDIAGQNYFGFHDTSQ